MAHIIDLKTFKDDRGSLSVVEGDLGFNIQRLFYIYGVPADEVRGQHGHKKTKMGLVSVSGSCKVRVEYKEMNKEFLLDSPHKCLLLEPEDWHEMYEFEKNTVLLVMASEKYSKDDYFTEIIK